MHSIDALTVTAAGLATADSFHRTFGPDMREDGWRRAHIPLFVPDAPRAIGFFCRRLGFRLSPPSGDGIRFTQGRYDSDRRPPEAKRHT